MFITSIGSIGSLLSISWQLCQRNKLYWFDTTFFLDKSMSSVFYHLIILEVLINCSVIRSRIFPGIKFRLCPIHQFLPSLLLKDSAAIILLQSPETSSSPLWILEKFLEVWDCFIWFTESLRLNLIKPCKLQYV